MVPTPAWAKPVRPPRAGPVLASLVSDEVSGPDPAAGEIIRFAARPVTGSAVSPTPDQPRPGPGRPVRPEVFVTARANGCRCHPVTSPELLVGDSAAGAGTIGPTGRAGPVAVWGVIVDQPPGAGPGRSPVNRWVIGLLRSPLRRLLDPGMTMQRYRARSDREIILPVGYVGDAGGWWWRSAGPTARPGGGTSGRRHRSTCGCAVVGSGGWQPFIRRVMPPRSAPSPPTDTGIPARRGGSRW